MKLIKIIYTPTFMLVKTIKKNVFMIFQSHNILKLIKEQIKIFFIIFSM